MTPQPDTSNPACTHSHRTFRKAPGVQSLAVLVCLNCGWQEEMSFNAALRRITMEEQEK